MKETDVFHWDDKTPDAVRKCLTDFFHSGERVRIWYGNPETGEAWPEENDVTGTVGRSTGGLSGAGRKIPLLIANRRTDYGGSILVANVVRIDEIKGRRTVYRHPRFDPGAWSYAHAPAGGVMSDANPWAVYRNGSLHARFPEKEKAADYCQFMAGMRYRK